MFKKRFAQLSPAALAIFLVAPVPAAFAQGAPFDATAEVAALFRAVRSDTKRPQRCEYATTWASDEDGTAAHFLDGPPAPQPAVVPTPQEVLGINQAETLGLCDAKEKQRYLAARIRAVEQGVTSGFNLDETFLTFPIFSQDRTHAVYLETSVRRSWSMTPDGVKQTHAFSSQQAILCSKKNGAWRAYGTELLFIAE